MRDLTTKETATVLAALRLFQQVGPPGFCPDGTPIAEMDQFAEAEPLTDEEIDSLCETINCGDDDEDEPAEPLEDYDQMAKDGDI